MCNEELVPGPSGLHSIADGELLTDDRRRGNRRRGRDNRPDNRRRGRDVAGGGDRRLVFIAVCCVGARLALLYGYVVRVPRVVRALLTTNGDVVRASAVLTRRALSPFFFCRFCLEQQARLRVLRRQTLGSRESTPRTYRVRICRSTRRIASA